jgi:hypothetical protein
MDVWLPDVVFKSVSFGGDLGEMHTKWGIRLSGIFAPVRHFCRPLEEWGTFMIDPRVALR